MKCANCGKHLHGRISFCSACGAAAPEPAKRKKLPTLAIVCMLLSVLLIASVARNVSANVVYRPVRLEGEGYHSPEMAVRAYVSALSEGDMSKMLSTFAIESYVENYDLKANIAANGYYSYMSQEVPLPNDSLFASDLNRYARLALLDRQIKYGYYSLTGIEFTKAEEVFSRRKDDFSENISFFVDNLGDPDFDKKLSAIKIGRILDVSDFDIDREIYNRSFSYNLSRYGNVEELQELALEFTFDGKDYYQFMLTGKINGKWYNLQMVSSLGMLMDARTDSGGILER